MPYFLGFTWNSCVGGMIKATLCSSKIERIKKKWSQSGRYTEFLQCNFSWRTIKCVLKSGLIAWCLQNVVAYEGWSLKKFFTRVFTVSQRWLLDFIPRELFNCLTKTGLVWSDNCFPSLLYVTHFKIRWKWWGESPLPEIFMELMGLQCNTSPRFLHTSDERNLGLMWKFSSLWLCVIAYVTRTIVFWPVYGNWWNIPVFSM